jgi:hypothetical protein
MSPLLITTTAVPVTIAYPTGQAIVAMPATTSVISINANVVGPPGPPGPGAAPSLSLVADDNINTGMPLAISRTTGHFILARADTYVKSFVFGLAFATVATGLVVLGQTGEMSLSDWTSVVGTVSLSAGQVYFLAPTGGLTLMPPIIPGQAVTIVGKALNQQTFLISPESPILR